VDDLGGESTERGCLSRRELIRRGAVVRGVAWTAPLIIESITSPAAAGSHDDCTGGSVTLFWIWILYRVGSPGSYTDYTTGFNNTTNSQNCGGGGANPKGVCNADCPAGVSFTVPKFIEDATYHDVSGTCGAPQLSPSPQLPGNCATYIAFSNGKIFSQGGAEILAAVAFGAGDQERSVRTQRGPATSSAASSCDRALMGA
jgi:hypothetical protein